ncbi:MAG: hypothetical protein ABR508_01780 [Candidatus Baltobacteraceae bacterium]
MNGHAGESAELYAIGSLDAAQAAAFEGHVRGCAPCAARMRQAAEAFAQIESARVRGAAPPSLGRRLHGVPRHASHARHWWTTGLAVAAAFAISLIPTWVAVDRNRWLRSAMNADELALARIAAAPSVERASFLAAGRPMGKVLYGARGDWYYILIVHPKRAMQIAYVHNGRREMLGTIRMHGSSGTLYLPIDHRMDELALMDGDTVVADAHLAY